MNQQTQCALGLSEEHLCTWGEQRIHTQMQPHFEAMQRAAEKDGIALEIASSYRGFKRQAAIWNAKFSNQRPILDINENSVDTSALSELEKCHAIMLFSALPGASRHHLGTDVDVFDANALPAGYQLQLVGSEYSGSGIFAKLSQWLDENMAEFGFYRPYDKYRGGVASEPWHLSHYETAQPLVELQSVDNIAGALEAHQVAGSATLIEHLTELHDRYVTNVAKL